MNIKNIESINTYKFEEDQQKSVGSMCIRNPVHDHKIIPTWVDIFKADAWFLIDLNLLLKYKFYVDNVNHCHSSTKLNLKPSLACINGHLHLEYYKFGTTMPTKSESFLLNREFSNPSSENFANPDENARPSGKHSEWKILSYLP